MASIRDQLGLNDPLPVQYGRYLAGLLGAGWYSRMMRSSMIEVPGQDLVRTARAKGLSRLRIVTRHVMPNAILPIIAMIGIDIGLFMSGIVVVESVFGWPGIGQLAWQAIQRVDIPVIMLVFDRVEEYHRDGVPKLDRVTFDIGLEPPVALLRLQNGGADVPGDGIPPAQFPQVVNDAAYEDRIVEGGQLQTGYIATNTRMDPFDRVEVRRAVNMARSRAARARSRAAGTGRGTATRRSTPAPRRPTRWSTMRSRARRPGARSISTS